MLIINIVKPKDFFELVKKQKLEIKHLKKFAYVITSDNEKELDEFDEFVGNIINNIIKKKIIVVNPNVIQEIFDLYTEYEISISKYMHILIETSTILGIMDSSDENTYRLTTKRYMLGPAFIHLYANYPISEHEEDVFLEYNRAQLYKEGMKLKERREKEESLKKGLEKPFVIEEYHDHRIIVGNKNKFKGDVAIGGANIEKK